MSKRQQNSSLKMCVSSALTNNGTVAMRLIAIGRAFHNRGPTTWNERSPKLTSFVCVTSNRCCCDERVRPVEHCRFSMSARYSGAVPSVHRNTCTSRLVVLPVPVENILFLLPLTISSIDVLYHKLYSTEIFL